MLSLTLLLCCCLTGAANAAQVESYARKGFTLVFESQDSALNPAVKERFINTFFEVYPKLVKTYNTNSRRKVQFVVDTGYKGVAATSNGRVVFGAKYIKAKPGDIDVITHEVMHIVQDYGRSVGPGWLTEGIADYVRYNSGWTIVVQAGVYLIINLLKVITTVTALQRGFLSGLKR